MASHTHTHTHTHTSRTHTHTHTLHAHTHTHTHTHTHAQGGHTAIAQRLVNAGANIDAEAGNGETPLHLARDKVLTTIGLGVGHRGTSLIRNSVPP